MRVFLDTNILLDIIEGRQKFLFFWAQRFLMTYFIP